MDVTGPGGGRSRAAMLLYPGVTLLDLIAPQSAFARTMEVHVVAKDPDPVRTDSGMLVRPTATFEDCPADVDVLFVPGGLGQAPTAADETVLSFLEGRAARAREAVRDLISAHGASSFAETSDLQRIWRDSEVASRHAIANPAIGAEVYDRALLGFADGVTSLV
jgi:putative intracellular protease/amidase